MPVTSRSCFSICPSILPGTNRACMVIIRKDGKAKDLKNDSALHKKVALAIRADIREYEKIPEEEEWMENQKQNEIVRKAWNGEDWHKTLPGSFDQWMSKDRSVNVRQCNKCFLIFRTVFDKNNHNIEIKAENEGQCQICFKSFRLVHQYFAHRKYCGFLEGYVKKVLIKEKEERARREIEKPWIANSSRHLPTRKHTGSSFIEPMQIQTSPTSGSVSDEKTSRSESSNRLIFDSGSKETSVDGSPCSSLAEQVDGQRFNQIGEPMPLVYLPNPPWQHLVTDYDPNS